MAPFTSRAVRALFALTLAYCSNGVASELRLRPNQNGYIGAWLYAVVPARALTQPEILSLEARYGKTSTTSRVRWQLVASRGTLNAATDIRPRPGTSSTLLLASTLVLSEPLSGFLMLSVNGETEVLIDGHSAFRRSAGRGRGRAWQVTDVHLESGSHPILVKLNRTVSDLNFDFRLLDKTTSQAPVQAEYVLADVPASMTDAVGKTLTQLDVTQSFTRSQIQLQLGLDFPRGAPAGWTDRVMASKTVLHGQKPARPRVLEKAETETGMRSSQVNLARFDAADPPKRNREVTVNVSIEGARFQRRAFLDWDAHALLNRSENVVASLSKQHFLDFQGLVDTLELHRQRLREALRESSRTQARSQKAPLEELLHQLERGTDPLTAPGIKTWATVSPLDGHPQPILIHVPSSFSRHSSRRYPLVIALHGYNGTTRGIMRAFLDRTSPLPHPQVDGFVIAPHAYGNSFYRGPGEYEVLRVLHWALGTLPIDPDRVSITGVSMGGTGAAHLALRYPDYFAAAAPLCGYHSYFLRRDVKNRRRRAWEVSLLHRFSTSSWAEQARHTPFFVAHGLRDHPLENSRVLIDRLVDLGYRVEQEWPNTGHRVWERTYAHAKLWSWLSQQKRTSAPKHVTLRTDSLRYGASGWVTIEQLSSHGTAAEVDARVAGSRSLNVVTSNVRALTLESPPGLEPQGPVRIDIDGQQLEARAARVLRLLRSERRWRSTADTDASRAPSSPVKKAGLEGPIDDVFLDRVLFVYGTGKATTRLANREVAEAFSAYGPGVDIHYPVVADTAVTPEQIRDYSLFLVGRSDDHVILGRIAHRLPISAGRDSIWAQGRQYRGKSVGAIFVWPNPISPERYVVVVTAPNPSGIWQALSLPKLLPDHIVYDAELGSAASETMLGDTNVLLSGFFDEAWQLP